MFSNGDRTAISASISTSTGRRRSWSCRRSASPTARRSPTAASGSTFDVATAASRFTYYDLRLPLTPPTYARILARIEAEPFPELARRFAVARPETSAAVKEELAALARDPLGQAADRRGDRRDCKRPCRAARAARGAGLARGLLARGARGAHLPPLLRDRRSGRRARRAAARLRRRARASAGAGRRRAWCEGIRLDHIDGLADPKAYLQRLQAAIGGTEPFYLLVEKILGPGEGLRQSWPVAGTTGYEFIEALAGLFTDAARRGGARPRPTRSSSAAPVDYENMVRETKRRMLARNLAGELEFLQDLAGRVAGARSGDARLWRRQPAPRDHGIRRRAPGLPHLRQCRGRRTRPTLR